MVVYILAFYAPESPVGYAHWLTVCDLCSNGEIT